MKGRSLNTVSRATAISFNEYEVEKARQEDRRTNVSARGEELVDTKSGTYFPSKSAYIRYLHFQEGLETQEITEMLRVRYQMVHNVIERARARKDSAAA